MSSSSFDDVEDYSFDMPSKDKQKEKAEPKKKKKNASEVYQKLDQLDHVLVRPDTYVGSVGMEEQMLWVLADDGVRMVRRKVSFVPALYKIFDEVLVNAADNYQRDSSMSSIKVEINERDGYVSVWNNGRGIPVEMHSKEKIYIPELIFGHMLTSSNYNDEEKKVTGGRNGFGAKLANIFSRKFTVETFDSDRALKFSMTWKNNMKEKGEPKVATHKARGGDFTKVTFYPDFPRFQLDGFTPDILALLKKRVYDIAGCNSKLKVYLNGEQLPIRSFEKYVEMYFVPPPEENSDGGSEEEDGGGDDDDGDNDDGSDFDGEEKCKKKAKGEKGKKRRGSSAGLTVAFDHVFERVNDRWEVCVARSPDSLGFEQVSFVNSIWTIRGGTHVDHFTKKLVDHILKSAERKNKGVKIRAQLVKQNLFVFVNSLIVNPAFDSQTKETLKSQVKTFGSSCDPSEKFMKAAVTKLGIVDAVLTWAKASTAADLQRQTGAKKRVKLTGIPKLSDANKAGGRKAKDCTLVLTEGDSAMTSAMAGVSEVGRDYYGIFPLKGKLLNVRDAHHSQISKNEELKNIMKILGLQPGATDTSKLRYGRLMIMTDQDHDGSHIKGLLINFLDHFCPKLLEERGFLCEFVTPIVKVTKGRQSESFFTLTEYQNWRQQLLQQLHQGAAAAVSAPGAGLGGWRVKYYKGLGTSTPQEFKGYFKMLKRHRIDFVWRGPEDRALINLAFSKAKADDRKRWIEGFVPGTFVDNSQPTLSYGDFINKELIHFSIADCARSIPSMVDGLKPGQRKILYACFKRNLRQEVKVAQLSSYVAEHTGYHHGETSLANTIVVMAQNFVGANNVNLLYPSGAFGSRRLGGADAASSRYIFTKLSSVTRRLFPREDDALLTYLEDDGYPVEPQYYVPVIPTVLVNGASGIGTGWSTDVPQHNPRDIIACLRRRLLAEKGKREAEPEEELHPWYRGFRGTIDWDENSPTPRYQVSGVWSRPGPDELVIEELPLGMWTQKYKEHLDQWTNPQPVGKKNVVPPALVKDFTEHHTDSTVRFVITLNERGAKTSEENISKTFKLTTTISVNNMHLFNGQGAIRRYDSSAQIIDEHFALRMDLYVRRKAYLIRKMERQLERVDAKVRFILGVVDGEIKVSNVPKAELIARLEAMGFPKLTKKEMPEEGPDAARAADQETAAKEKDVVDRLAAAVDGDDDDDNDGDEGGAVDVDVGEDDDIFSDDDDFDDDGDGDFDDDDDDVFVAASARGKKRKAGGGAKRKAKKPKRKKKGAAAALLQKKGKKGKKGKGNPGMALGYDYLLSMNLWSLTREKVAAMRSTREEMEHQLEALRAKAPNDMWLDDLAALEEALEVFAEEMSQVAEAELDYAPITPGKKKPVGWSRAAHDQRTASSSSGGRKAARPAKLHLLDDDDDSVDGDGGDGESEPKEKTKTKTKSAGAADGGAASQKKKKARLLILSDDEDDNDDDADKKEEKKKVSKKKPKNQQEEEEGEEEEGDDDNDDDEEEDSDDDDIFGARLVTKSLQQRLAERKKAGGAGLFSAPAKRITLSDSDSDGDDDVEEKRPQKKVAPAPKKMLQPAAAPAKKVASKKKKLVKIESEDEMDNSDSPPPPPKKAVTGRRAASQKKTYKFSESEEDDFDQESEDDDDDDLVLESDDELSFDEEDDDDF